MLSTSAPFKGNRGRGCTSCAHWNKKSGEWKQNSRASRSCNASSLITIYSSIQQNMAGALLCYWTQSPPLRSIKQKKMKDIETLSLHLSLLAIAGLRGDRKIPRGGHTRRWNEPESQRPAAKKSGGRERPKNKEAAIKRGDSSAAANEKKRNGCVRATAEKRCSTRRCLPRSWLSNTISVYDRRDFMMILPRFFLLLRHVLIWSFNPLLSIMVGPTSATLCDAQLYIISISLHTHSLCSAPSPFVSVSLWASVWLKQAASRLGLNRYGITGMVGAARRERESV